MTDDPNAGKGDETETAKSTLPSVEEMQARLAELVEQHGADSDPVKLYQAELDAHPDLGNWYAPGMEPDPAKSQEAGVAGMPADPAKD